MFVAILIICGAMTSCKKESVGSAPIEAAVVEGEETYFTAIEKYLADSIGRGYSQGDVCIPFIVFVAADERNADDILVWGDFWVDNYILSGDTLKTISGGSHPGLMHVRQTGTGYEVTAFEQTVDGAGNMKSAKKIFGDKFARYQTMSSDMKNREAIRTQAIADYVRQHGLTATMYQDAGWKAVALPK